MWVILFGEVNMHNRWIGSEIDKASSTPSTLERQVKQGVELDLSISTHNTLDMVADMRRLCNF